MTVTISATLLSGSPAPVQVVVTGVPAGEPYEVRGEFGLDSWSVPGGRGVGDGAQVVLVDSRAPLRSAVTYVVRTSEDRVYAWSGTPGASPSTMTTAGGVVTNLEPNPRFVTASGIPAGMTRELQPDGAYYLVNPARATSGYGHSPYGHSEYGN